jgi:hypothetical protein
MDSPALWLKFVEVAPSIVGNIIVVVLFLRFLEKFLDRIEDRRGIRDELVEKRWLTTLDEQQGTIEENTKILAIVDRHFARERERKHQ